MALPLKLQYYNKSYIFALCRAASGGYIQHSLTQYEQNLAKQIPIPKMKLARVHERLAVCSWSLQPTSPEDLIQKLKLTGIMRVQLELDPLRDEPKVWGDTEKILRENGVTVVSGMVRCLGEDYTSLESIRATGGIAPDATWQQNLNNISAAAGIAKKMGLKLVTFHAGFLPPNEFHPTFAKMRERLDTVADIFMVQNIMLGLETGQETAQELAALLKKLNHPNIGVNFDPANMLLYDKGDPVKALHTLAPWIRQVHIKDARRTKIPGTWGEEVPVGSGEVDWVGFFSTFKHVIFNVNLVIEREYGNTRETDIRKAREVVERTFF
jgi:L-ribulose-5-phosphate 3-epimerase